jgi:hypothetical protein
MVAVSFRPVRPDNGKIYGNTLFVFRNVAQQIAVQDVNSATLLSSL